MPNTDTEHDVLIVGAGPSGLMTAIELARFGVRPRIVDEAPEPHQQTRATRVMPGSLIALQRIGIADEFVERGVQCLRTVTRDSDLNELARVDLTNVDGPFKFALLMPQHTTEELLNKALNSLGVYVERGVRVTSFEPHMDGTVVNLEGPNGPETECYSSLVGAGGAHSLLRMTLGNNLEGGEYGHKFVIVDVVTDSGLPVEEVTKIHTRVGSIMTGPLPGGRNALVFDIAETHPIALGEEVTIEHVRELLIERTGFDWAVRDLQWASPFTLHHRVAPVFTDGRRHLVGDSAHIGSIYAGMGMNEGLQDAVNLAWKLALHLKGRAHKGLIDTYDIERRPAIFHGNELSEIGLHRLVEGRKCMSAKEESAKAALMLDVSYAGSPLVYSHLGPNATFPEDLVAGEQFPDTSVHCGAAYVICVRGHDDETNALGKRWGDLVSIQNPVPDEVPPDCLVAIRPDGFIGLLASPADAAAFGALDAQLSAWFVPETAKD